MRRLRSLLLGMFVCLGLSQCDDSDSTNNGEGRMDSPSSPVEVRDVLAFLAEEIYLPATGRFLEQAQALETATSAYREDSDNPEKRQNAKVAWRSAMHEWQKLELMQVGPLSSMNDDVGAQDLRVEVYSYPATFSSCKIDVELTEEDFRNVESFRQKDIKTRGLDAMEYLLFSESDRNECPTGNTGNPINLGNPSPWDQIIDTLRGRKATYAHTLSLLIVEEATKIERAWRVDGGNFVSQLADAGLEGNDFDSAQEALQSLFNGLFYIEKTVKDTKIAWPTGIAVTSCRSCTDVNPAYLESRYASASKDHLLVNLRTFQDIFWGGSPESEDTKGIRDLLIELGEDGELLAMRMEQGLSTVIEELENKEGTMRDILAGDPQFFRDFYNNLNESVVRPFKIEVTTYLGVDVPMDVASDTD